MPNNVLTLLRKNKVYVGLAIIAFLFINYLSYYLRVGYENHKLSGLANLFDNPSHIFVAFPISFNLTDLLLASLSIIVMILLIIEKQSNHKKYRKGVEHGSSSWGDLKEYNEMMDLKDNDNNLILSKNLRLRLNDKNAPFDTRRNKHMIVYGGSGSGKTRFMIKPNMLQMNSSYVITDPKGELINELGMALKNKGNYKIKVFNTINFKNSMKYNPLAYVKDEADILSLVDTLIENTSSRENVDSFWEGTEKLLYQSYLSIIVDKFPKEERHFGTLVDMISYSQVKEDDEDYKNAIDYLFEKLEKTEPNHFAVAQYKNYKLAAGKTTKSILINCATRLAPFNIPSVRELLNTDEMNLHKIGDKLKDKNKNDRKTALFVLIPDTDPTFNFLVSIMYTQLFDILINRADEKYGGALPNHVKFLLDEFANIGLIPNFEKLIATMRSRNMSATIVLQTLSQLKSLYKDNAETIEGNCDTSIFLGGGEKSTIKALSEGLGKETIDDYNESKTRSNADSYGQNYSKLGRELMTEDEIKRMPRDECIVEILGKKPYKDKKYPLEKHPRFKYHADGTKYWFDINKYLKAVRKHPTKKVKKEQQQSKKQEKQKNNEVEAPKVPTLTCTTSA